MPRLACISWDNSGPMLFGTGGQVLPVGWVTTDLLLGNLQLIPPSPPVWSPHFGGARRGRGCCFRCNQLGQYVLECQVLPVHMNIAVPSQPTSAHGSTTHVCTRYGTTPYPFSMSPSGSWPRETHYCNGGYTSGGAPPPPFSSSSPDLFNQHRFTVQWRTKAKLLVVVFLWF